MANEATLIYETSTPIPFTVYDGLGIEKGALLTLLDISGPVVSAHSSQAQAVGGIAAEEKIANDGKTKIAVYRSGIFKVYISGSVTVGDPVMLSAVANQVGLPLVNAESIFGIVLETATNGETALVELRPTSMNLA